MFYLIHKKLLITFILLIITFLSPVITKTTTTSTTTSASTTTKKSSNINPINSTLPSGATINHRARRPQTNRTSVSHTNHNPRNVTNPPRIIERIIESLTISPVINLTKTTTTRNIVTTSKLVIPLEKSKNSGLNSINLTSNQGVRASTILNYTNEFRDKKLNEKNSSLDATTINASLIETATLTSIPIASNLDFYLDPIEPDSNDESPDTGSEIANLTVGYDSYLINENINAFTTGTGQCPKCKCGVRTIKRVIGGDIVVRNKIPWIALLTSNRQFFCAGSLINNLYVVTAGHCTTTFSKEKIQVNLKENSESEDGTIVQTITRGVSQIFRPINFNQNTFFNDIAILKLSEPVDISSGLIRPICLPIDKTSFVGKVAQITGWRMNYEDEVSLQMTRSVNSTILSNRQCLKTLVGKLITPTMICSSSSKPNHGTECRGDSGGPLMVTQKGRSRLAGIVSWGLGCIKKNGADVFTRTTKFNGWLRKLSQDACWCN